MRSGPYEPDKRWVGHVVHMEDGRIPNGKLAEGKRPTARRQLRYKDVCKRDLEAMDVDLTTWEAVVSDWTAWRQTVHWERLIHLWTVTHTTDWGKEKEEKGPRPSLPTGNGFHLRPVRQELPLPHRTFQSYPIPTLHQYHHPERSSIVSQDWWMPRIRN